MLAILSPAKTLDFETPLTTKKFSEPEFVAESTELISHLRKLSPTDLSAKMKISDALAELNVQRYADWSPSFEPDAARPAIHAFKGDVYLGLDAPTLSARDHNYAQKHVRILSGLHGLLRPLDRMRPYRLEMGTALKTKRGKDLYEFWGSKVTDALNTAISENNHRALINLASNEYANVLHSDAIDARLINVKFLDYKNGQYKFMSFFGKRARGSMARYMIDQRVKSLKQLREFDYDGYGFNEERSKGDNWVFTRKQAA
ncbi:MAG: peroxide stress protein YaaA [Lysobacterales bacterium]